VSAFVALSIASAALPARAQQTPSSPAAVRPRVAIAYTRKKGAERCPDGSRLRESIIGSVGSAVEIVDGAASARDTIEVTVTRKSGRYVAEWKRADAEKPPRVFEDANCELLIENVAESIVVNVEPSPVVVAPKPAEPPPRTPPAPPRTPGVFEGSAGAVRIAALVVGGVSLAVGTGFAAAAAYKAADIGTIDRGLSLSACSAGSVPLPSQCSQVVPLAHEHDTYSNTAIGLMTAGASVAVLAAVSILIVRTPAHAVEVTPAAPGALAALSLRGSW
jgi:hypothetical protein